MTATDVRKNIIEALSADLIGPFDLSNPTESEEVLSLPPSRWYLTGFLAPQISRETQDPTSEDEFGNADEDSDEEPPSVEPEAKPRNHFPASIGMSVLLPPALPKPETITATVRYANYRRIQEGTGEGKTQNISWQRMPNQPVSVSVPLDNNTIERGIPVPNSNGLVLVGKLETVSAPGLDDHTRALSLFIVNAREQVGINRDESFAFQVSLELTFSRGFVPRPNFQGEQLNDFDDRVSDVQYRDHCEWAVGHNTSIETPNEDSGSVDSLRTTWIPQTRVLKVSTYEDKKVITAMDALASLEQPEALIKAMEHIVLGYDQWIIQQQSIQFSRTTNRDEVRDLLVKKCKEARARIQDGIHLVATDSDVRKAFLLMNRAMSMAALKRSPGRYKDGKVPSWRLFQLAFILLCISGIAIEDHPDREIVELIFFPTGGGKTEAYLGVIAFTILLRRLKGRTRPDKGYGVAVLLRYTLRLLTLDQLGRAATLICALEILRQKDPENLGSVRFSVGLWVGSSGSPNTFEQAKAQILEYRYSASEKAVSPFPLVDCPWCGTVLGPTSLEFQPTNSPNEILVRCVSRQGQPASQCEFSPRKNPDGIPVVFVDEQVYQELPCFVVGTVDKFAMLPWRGETGTLFGRAFANEGRKFYGPIDTPKKLSPTALRFPGGLRPPELIVQDELHLISGPLGTMVGLYETAIDFLCTRKDNGRSIGPKIIASTATVRRAKEQILALYARKTELFPPQGVNPSDTFFASLDKSDPGRLYIGVAAPGRSLKAILLRTYIALLASAKKQYQDILNSKRPTAQQEAKDCADAYMTLVGYFNSLRELGGMRRLVEDDIRTRLHNVEERTLDGKSKLPHPWATNRDITIPVELTSREQTESIKDTKARLNLAYAEKNHVDVLLASNMIAVGVDIDRLGLMVVGGQPKTTSEYIQATSRVGRQYPGLVVTCFNTRKPRDRSHYERFVAYHESFYRYVEATSVTPFSGRAVDRGLAGTLLSMARLGLEKLTLPSSVMDIEHHEKFVDECIEAIATRAKVHVVMDADQEHSLFESLRSRGKKLLDAWIKLVKEAKEGATSRSYSPLDKDKTAGKPLLFWVTDEKRPAVNTLDAYFAAPTSMRDVEPSVPLWVERRALGGK